MRRDECSLEKLGVPWTLIVSIDGSLTRYRDEVSPSSTIQGVRRTQNFRRPVVIKILGTGWFDVGQDPGLTGTYSSRNLEVTVKGDT